MLHNPKKSIENIFYYIIKNDDDEKFRMIKHILIRLYIIEFYIRFRLIDFIYNLRFGEF